jgi:hypothetical protein
VVLSEAISLDRTSSVSAVQCSGVESVVWSANELVTELLRLSPCELLLETGS